MKIFLIALVFMVSPFLLVAHNPLSARYYLDAGEKVSLLTINLSQNGVNQILLKQYSTEELDNMSRKQFEELIVDYIKSNFTLSVGKQEIKLKEGGIKLGSHQTDLKFVLPPVTKSIEDITIHIPAFNENKNHQTIFSYNIKGKTDHVILSAKNNYESALLSTTSAKTSNWLVFGLIGLVSLVSIVLVKLSFNAKEPAPIVSFGVK